MFSPEQLTSITNGRLIGPETGPITGISTDSRTIKPGELFVPLQGDRFDGHDYIHGLATRRITTSLCSEAWLQHQQPPATISCIAVQDTLRALGDLAAAFRKRFALTMIGVTGSNGKTTTKEMLAAILGKVDQGLKTSGNLNNLIGLPQMLFQLKPEHCWAVLEMGMSEPGEIDRLAEIACPSIGIVLNAYPAHLQSMGSVEAVAQAKGELLNRIQDGGLAVVNADDPRIASLHQNPSARRISFGIRRGEVRAEEIQAIGTEGQTFKLVTPKGSIQIQLKALGQHNIYNALAAAAGLLELVGLETIAEGLEAFTPYSGRFHLEQLSNNRLLIDDSYNANPASCAVALATLRDVKGSNRVLAAFGDMLELGKDELELHRQLGMQAASVADRLYLLGNLTKETASAAKEAGMGAEAIVSAASHEEIANDIIKQAGPGDLILVKGSRGMKMEKIAALLRAADRQEA
ncbi:UDP-N-acetylmuramoyl-tripeptide--D-alanyl-D-alanine ligase [Trichlorobacter thiogenes]|uniref:UDP-N-acetylmuramoyl-tripeptide--D-alanyl-D-alanine ligase n=1 Tax=Trichlorobacter thiogenes TaxID=115783 RepID=A0A1T4Q6U0_9BACT|nr:UDP-N-acetylmuramoyl-tripeptide--D-alanyl-D-alanine ligase [Trichlorobacter thiogenes]SJZ99404.1 UDP-N-acetylmuramoyl-tripeptide--D-alanyl-D-alanine ligase [Trichlorobacter thiogenes]